MFGMGLHGTKLRNAMPFRTNNPAVAEPNTSDHSHTQRARGTGHGTERGKSVCIPLHSIQCALQQCFSPVLLSPSPFAFRICCLSRSCPSERVSSVSTTHHPSTCLRQQTKKNEAKFKVLSLHYLRLPEQRERYVVRPRGVLHSCQRCSKASGKNPLPQTSPS